MLAIKAAVARCGVVRDNPHTDLELFHAFSNCDDVSSELVSEQDRGDDFGVAAFIGFYIRSTGRRRTNLYKQFSWSR
jgi:hypothetical protein